MKLIKNIAVLLAIANIISACSGGGPTTPSGSSSTLAVPESIKSLLEAQCQNRPQPLVVGSATINGQFISGYTEVLSESDEGNIISGSSQLHAKDLVGNLYVEPATDGNVTWAARKWALAANKTKSDTALAKISISSKDNSDNAEVMVSHPNSILPGERYTVCVVVRAPAEWIHTLSNGTGNLTSVSHSGNLNADVETGNLDIEQSGTGYVTAQVGTGDMSVVGDSRGGVDLQADTGTLTYTLHNGGTALKTNSQLVTGTGSIVLNIEDGFGFHLDASTDVGSIDVPSIFPQPESVNVTGSSLALDANGGGASLTIHAGTGSIEIN